MAQSLELRCPQCRQRLTCEAGAFSQAIQCVRCQHSFRPDEVVGHDEPLPALVVEDSPATTAEPEPEPVEAATADPEPEPEPVEAAAAEPEPDPVEPAPTQPKRTARGTVLLDDAGVQDADPGTRRGPAELPSHLDAELRGVAAALVADVGRRLSGRTGTIVTVAVPVTTVVAFLLLGWASSSLARALLAIVATVGLASVVTVAGSAALSKRHASPARSTLRALAGLSTAGRVSFGGAALLVLAASAGVALVAASASGRSDDTATALVATPVGLDLAPPPAPARAPSALPSEPTHPDLVVAEGMVLHVPDNLPIAESFDLLIHFAGRPKVVEDSVAVAGLRAAVVIANLGEGSGPYMEKFGGPDAFTRLISTIEERVVERGMPNGARVRRVAVSSFGAGYGAVLKLVSVPSTLERIDAVLVMEGLYTSYIDPRERAVDTQRIAPYVELAKKAKQGDKLFAVTHSNVESEEFATAKAVSDAILESVDVERKPYEQSPPVVELKSARSLFAKGPVSLEAESRATSGSLYVLGYAGKTAEHHVAHLAQMSVTVLPLLVRRWSEAAP